MRLSTLCPHNHSLRTIDLPGDACTVTVLQASTSLGRITARPGVGHLPPTSTPAGGAQLHPDRGRHVLRLRLWPEQAADAAIRPDQVDEARMVHQVVGRLGPLGTGIVHAVAA